MNKDALMKLIEKRWEEKDDNPIVFDAYVQAVADCVGKDRDALIKFIKTEDHEYVYALGEAYEEIMANFPGDDELEDLFAQYVLPVYP